MFRICVPAMALLALSITACQRSTDARQTAGAAPANVNLQGAGATFPYPLYSKWIAQYQQTDPRVRVNYQSIGSGGGIKQITERTIDFGATDVAMTDAELAKTSSPILHIPMTLGAVALTYNLPGFKGDLKVSPEVLVGIFTGAIKKWNDPQLAAINTGTTLPDQAITVVYRSDGSGTTGVFTEYLAAVSADWKQKVGSGKSVAFPTGLGAKGNEGVTGQVKTTPGALGYVELAYATQVGLPVMSIKNRDGKFVPPALEGISAAAAGVAATMPADLRVSIVNAPGEQSYPISSFSYILVYEEQKDGVKGKALAQFLWWAVHDGQISGPALHYAPLPPALVQRVEAQLRRLRMGNQPLLAQGSAAQ